MAIWKAVMIQASKVTVLTDKQNFPYTRRYSFHFEYAVLGR